MSLTSLLDVTCNVQRQTATADAVGSLVPSWANRLTNIPCVIQPSSTTAVPAFGGDFSRPDAVFLFSVVTAVDIQATTQDRIVVSAGPYAGTYPVKGYIVSSNAMISGEIVATTYCIKRN
jgi:hypothetical protein